MTRRELLSRYALGAGAWALDAAPLPHAKPRARSVIFLFMEGGPSQLDLLDAKPALRKYDGQPLPESMRAGLRFAFIQPGASVWASARHFQPRGQSGIEMSDWMPHLATQADRLSVIRSMVSDQVNHVPGQLLLQCGSPLPGRPSLGAWTLYGLGSEARDLPGFVVLFSGRAPQASGGIYTSGFLPGTYQGTPFRDSGDAVLHLSNPTGVGRADQRRKLDLIGDLNRQHQADTGDPETESRIQAYELAFRMQAAVPGLLDLSAEPAEVKARYGPGRFAQNCLMARRLVERGVRFVLVSHASWDDHADLNKNHALNCRLTDRPAAALLEDLHARGLLDSTLVVWGGEFGRTPLVQQEKPGRDEAKGRDHHPYAFSMWLAGGGIRPGQVIGRTDDFGLSVVEDKVEVHDLQATILHCLGLDHEKLTFRTQGRDFRLTDVGGVLLRKLLA